MFDFTVTRTVIGKRVLKPVDSLLNVVRTTIFTVLTKKFQNFFLFCSVSFFQKSGNSVFGTQLVPTTSELNLTGST